MVSHPVHECKRKTTVDPSKCLPLSDTSMDVISSKYTVKELLSCRAKGSEHRETKRHKIVAVISTTGRGDADSVHTTMVIALSTVLEDVGRPSESISATRVEPLA